MAFRTQPSLVQYERLSKIQEDGAPRAAAPTFGDATKLSCYIY
jgi:hypothetical protein